MTSVALLSGAGAGPPAPGATRADEGSDPAHPEQLAMAGGPAGLDHLPLVSRVVVRLMGSTGDVRHRPRIDAWADEIAHHLAGSAGDCVAPGSLAGTAGPEGGRH